MALIKPVEDRLLTGVSNAYMSKSVIAEKILTPIKTAAYAGRLRRYGNNALRIENAVKGGRGMYRRVETITQTTTSYFIEGHGLEEMVTKEDYRNYGDGFAAESVVTNNISNMLLLEKEKMLADTLRDVAVLTNNVTLSGTGQFNDYSASTPVTVFRDMGSSMINAAGVSPNAVIMDILVWNTLRFNTNILSALGYTQHRPGGLTQQEVGQALGVEKVFIADARYLSSKEGQPDVLAAIWGKDIIFAHVPDRAEEQQTSLGYLVSLEGTTPRKVYTAPVINPPGSTVILVEDEYDMLIANASAGYLIKNAIA